MKSCGVIVEYNPFHNGHQYHVAQAREKTQADVVIAVMSGNFLQRGEPAILDKWQRAEEALANGVDLVVELPTEWAVQSADYFAKGAVQLLQALQCENLCFGTDITDAFDYADFGKFVVRNQKQINEEFQRLSTTTMNYPQKMTAVYEKLYTTIPMDTPNHILGLSYAKENARYPRPMDLHPIARRNAAYHEKEIKGKIASATAIRQAIFADESVNEVVPIQTNEDVTTATLQSWEDYWPYLKYRLLTSSLEELQTIYQMNEGIEIRLKTAAQKSSSFQMFVEQVKTKRYTWTRIQRLACYVLLNITSKEIEEQQAKLSIHVLGFTQAGQHYLNQIKKASNVPIVTKVGKAESKRMAMTIRADEIYQLANEKIKHQNFGRQPVRLS
ncbi:MAG: nucleotidyltransferase [Enterococcus sp.]